MKRKGLFAALAAGVVIMAMTIPAAASVGSAQGFEDADGNLVPVSQVDWNTFATGSNGWTGTAPKRTREEVVSGFHFKGFEDYQASTSDDAFAGGTKQDDNCPSIITQKADNKADLKRIYVASKNISGEVYLDLAWVRIPQNTTSPSAHVAFEFNQNDPTKTPFGPCATAAGSPVKRQAGDMLIVYDFEGGATDNPHITLRRWVTSGACEISNDTAPCWGTATDLTDLGFAEAKVNTTTTVSDTVAPSNETLGVNEFGEAGIDLGPNGANVFPANQCVSFGKVTGVSRTSGNSGTAQMKDKVGPGDFRLSNCGSITVIKHTDPRGLNQAFGYTTTGGLSPSTFNLNDNGNTTGDSTGNTKTYSNVQAGQYTVSENDPPSGFTFESLTCTDSGGNSTTKSGKTATITVVGDGSTTCTYVNQGSGALKIVKTSSKSNAVAGATFSISGPGGYSNSVTTGADGTKCLDGLAAGSYTVTETAAPTGYAIDSTAGVTKTVAANGARCSDGTFAGQTFSFTDSPLSDIQVNFRDGGSGETSATISCDNASGTTSTTAASGWTTTKTITGIKAPTTVHCTITIDP